MNLNEATPSDIDEQLSELYIKEARAINNFDFYRSEKGKNSFRRDEQIAKYSAECDELREAIDPLENQYITRRWNRAFLVTNQNGHIHSSMHCNTCFPSTQYGWLPALSGKTEAEIIEYAGMKACTVCYPDAPVAKMTPAERKSHTRAEVEARKAVKAAAKLEKELAKVPRAHSAALKVDAVVTAYGFDKSKASADFYAGTGVFAGKSMDNSYYTYCDILRKKGLS